MIDLLASSFMRRALAAGVLVAAIAGYYGAFVVQRRMSFLGAGLAHAAFGGVALGLLLGIQPLWVALPFTVLVAVGIEFVRRRTGLSGDTAIGILFSVAVALGIVFLSLRENYTGPAITYLFGSILSVGPIDVWLSGAMAALTAGTLPLWSHWAYATFDQELARADRLPVRRDDYLLSVLLALTVVVSVKLVGAVLLAAFLVIPPATARLVSETFRTMTAVSIVLGVLTTVLGLATSYWMDFPSGATIVLVQAAAFGLVASLRAV